MMQLWNSLTPLGSAFRPRAIRWQELTAGGALLTCLAVVLNVGPFAGTFRHQAVRTTAERSVGSSAIARSQINAATPADRVLSDMEAMDMSVRLRPVMELSPASDDTFARLTYHPPTPKDREVAVKFDLPRPDRETAESAPQPLTTIVGVWAPDAGACSARDFREGLLPTIINPDGAWAGETFCIFKNQKQTETGWRVVASCSNPREHWTTQVRLTIKDNRLIWTSKRGTQTYSRCATDFLVAAAR